MKARACTIAAVLGLVLCVTSAGARERVHYFHNDHLGTPQAMSDVAGRKVWAADYEPFGKAAVNQDPDGDGQAVINNLRFPGQYYDAETGLHYNYHRDYDPATGRFLTPDPLGLEGGMNLYPYVTNNPINYTDPDGLQVAETLSRYGPQIVEFGQRLFGAVAGLVGGIAIGEAVKDKCSDDKPCVPPEGTRCYEEPAHSEPHGGLSHHYHIYEMQKKRPSGTCFWRYLGGKVGVGVLGTPAEGMKSCSTYPNFIGRGPR